MKCKQPELYMLHRKILTTFVISWLEGAGPQLGAEVIWIVLFTVTLQDVKRLQTGWLLHRVTQRCDNSFVMSR